MKNAIFFSSIYLSIYQIVMNWLENTKINTRNN